MDVILVVGIVKKYILFIGDMVIGIVKFIKFIYVVVILVDGIIGCIYVFYILDDVLAGIFFIVKLKVGKIVIVRVIGGRDVKIFKYGGFWGWVGFEGRLL